MPVITSVLNNGQWITGGAVEPEPPATNPVAMMLNTPGATWAHRGGGTNWPEMTAHAYTNALAAGYGCLEVSLGRTSDGVWFGVHDWTLDRTSGLTGSGWVGDLTWAQVQQHQVILGASGAPKPYMRWEELLTIIPPRTILVVDPKDFGGTHMQEFLAMVKNSWGTHRTIFKQYGGEVAMANLAAAAGFEHRWGHFYPADHADGSLAANQGAWTMLGMSYNASQTVWDAVNSYGKPTVAHICNSLAAYTMGISRGADMAQCANVLDIPAVTTWLD